MAGGNILALSDRGLAASHPDPVAPPVHVAPSVNAEDNTIRAFLIPCACSRIEDNQFLFDSSFIIHSGLTFHAGSLKKLLEKHPGAKLSLFGHADPVGRDNYNKVLSGRRAQAVFGLLVRDVAQWEDLYFDHDTNGKDKWGVHAIQLMLSLVEKLGAAFVTLQADEPTRQAVEAFERKHGLPVIGLNHKQEVAPATFRKLAEFYMNQVCVDDEGKEFKLTPDDFLMGDQEDGKGNVQGCGEFNPVLVFSQAEARRLEQERAPQLERNERNEPNRRVMILLFRSGTQLDPKRWPCPTVKEGVDGCKARFFSDGEHRRSNQAEERLFRDTKDTFACRFYHRLVAASPCEAPPVTDDFDIRLYDEQGGFIAHAPFRVHKTETTDNGSLASGFSDENGIAHLKALPPRIILEWGQPVPQGAPKQVPKELPFRLELELKVDSGTDEERALRCLNNLGYVLGETQKKNISHFQEDYSLAPMGKLDAPTKSKIFELHGLRPQALRTES